MVGIVVVSHSAQLAAGVRELAAQMAQEGLSFAVAGGIEDPENPIGTDAMQVLSAIESVYSDDGVVVLMDLGSALLSAELALEFLDLEQREHVYLCPAPVVEGAIAAAVQASIGSTVDEVIHEALHALKAKQAQLGVAETTDGSAAPKEVAPEAKRVTLTVRNRQGLHARPAAQFVRTASQYTAQIIVHKQAEQANAKSINQVATLGVRQGDTIEVAADGPDAAAALSALEALVETNFGEPTSEEPSPAVLPSKPKPASSTAQERPWRGIAASPGIAIAPAALYRPTLPEVTITKTEDPESEWQRLTGAIQVARQELEQLEQQAQGRLGSGEAAILGAHALILADPVLLEGLEERIRQEQLAAPAAWKLEMADVAKTYAAMEDSYMQARAKDVEDVAGRVLRQLLDAELPSLQFEEPVVLVAEDLAPSDTAVLDPEMIRGICTARGGATSHSAILARALGIPAVVGLGPVVAEVDPASSVALDGERGLVWLAPSSDELAQLEERRQEWQAARQRALAAGQLPAVTKDGRRVHVLANIGRPADVQAALANGAEGVGLFRTEFLFMDRAAPPTEEEQFEAYREVAQAMGERPVIIRTLDVGGDKPLPYLDMPAEENPFLGVRGIRFSLHRPDLFRSQLRAILRAGAGYNLQLMFPMIGALRELRAAKSILAEERAALEAEGVAVAAEMPVGIMIEVPAAVALADQLAREADFFSIGTNDLSGYVMAADRGNAQVAPLADALHPAVLRLVAQTAAAGHAAGISVGMCGELAGNPLITPVLLGLGLDELSMSATSIPGVKEQVRAFRQAAAQELVDEVLALETADAVRQHLAA